MKRFLLIFTLSSFLLSSFELDELLKISNLFVHFKEHQLLNNQLTFSDFLFNHYSIPDDHDGDSEKDEKLPFKKHHDCFIGQINIVLHQHASIKLKLVEENLSKPLPHVEENFPQGSLTNIWQPPKLS